VIHDRNEAERLELQDKCLLFYCKWRVYWRGVTDRELVIAATSDGLDMIDMVVVRSGGGLPAGCGKATICGEVSINGNNVIILFLHSAESDRFAEMVAVDEEMSELAAVLVFGPEDAQKIDSSVKAVDV
jgi:hypothetical protein